jgi:hypothetical protein
MILSVPGAPDISLPLLYDAARQLIEWLVNKERREPIVATVRGASPGRLFLWFPPPVAYDLENAAN